MISALGHQGDGHRGRGRRSSSSWTREMIEPLMYFMRQRGATFRLGEKVAARRLRREGPGRGVPREREGIPRRHAALHRRPAGQRRPAEPSAPPASPPTRAEGSPSTSTSRPRSPTSTRRATSSAFPRSPRRRWSRGAWRACHMFGPHARGAGGDPLRHLHDPRDLDGREDRAGADGRAKIPYEIGVSKLRGAGQGPDARRRHGDAEAALRPQHAPLLGVHIFGERATEIVHIGQAVLAFGGTIDYFRDAVFNYPTMAEAYKVAGLDGLNRL